MSRDAEDQGMRPLQRAYLKLEELEAKLAEERGARSAPIAIVGTACRLPGEVRNPKDYWQLLEEGRDAIREVPPERWDLDEFFDPDPEAPGKMYTRWGGFLEDIDEFDAHFFGITPREAANTDPQQRILLEVTWEALEQAGISPESLKGSRTGVFTGIGFNDYVRLLGDLDRRHLNGYSGSGAQLCFAAGRVSYVLGLRGPSMPVDTACSSSLVALHLACRSLRLGESDVALAGGVNLLLAPDGNIFLSKAGALSPTGRCRTFDASADGFVRSEGCAVLVLKRLDRALQDKDKVLAVIRGSAVNHDGRSSGLTVPNGPAQEKVMREALEDAGLAPEDVSYLEAHGTGTALGDPIEMGSISSVYRSPERTSPLLVGSVKTNLGHAESASSVASILKVVLMLQHEVVPPHLHFHEMSPHIDVPEDQIRIPTEPIPWEPSGDGRRIAAVSSFGLSGTNAHVLLEAPPEQNGESGAVRSQEPVSRLLVLSARKPEALADLVSDYQEALDGPLDGTWEQITRTAALGRAHHEHRLTFPARSQEEAARILRRVAHGEAAEEVMRGQRPTAGAPGVVFLFPGQGTPWAGMGRALMDSEPVFRRTFEKIAERFDSDAETSLVEDLLAPEDSSRLDRTEIAQPVLFAFSVALSDLWRSWGLEPEAVVGHSLGEVTAAHVAGALDLETAVCVVKERSRLLARLAGRGAMVAVGVEPDTARELLEGYEDRLAIAAVNGPKSVVLSGDEDALDEVLETLSSGKVFQRRLPVDYAFHSPQTEPLGDELVTALEDVLTPRPASIPIFSTATGRESSGTDLDAAHWRANLTQAVRFAPAVRTAIDNGHRVFLEISPHPVLCGPVGQLLDAQGADGAAVPSLRRDHDTREMLLENLGRLYTAGCDIRWEALHPESRLPVELPTYPWRGQRFWVEDVAGSSTAAVSRSRTRGPRHPLLGVELEGMADRQAWHWETELPGNNGTFLGTHRLGGLHVLPVSAVTRMVLAAGSQVYGDQTFRMTDLTLHRPLRVPSESHRRLQSALVPEDDGQATQYSLYSRAEEEPEWTLHATARLEQR